MQLEVVLAYIAHRHASGVQADHIDIAELVEDLFEGSVVLLEIRDVVGDHEHVLLAKAVL